jgi:hypothetical protein
MLDEQNELIHNDFVEDKFPMIKMEKGQSVDLPAIFHHGTKPKETLRIIWDDSSGNGRENRVEITV